MTPTPQAKKLQALQGIKVDVPQRNKKVMAKKKVAVTAAAKVNPNVGKKAAPSKKGKSLPAKDAAKKATAKKAAATAKKPAQNPALTDEEFVAKADAMLQGLGKQLATLRTKMFSLSASGHEEYAAKDEVPTEYETVQQQVFDIEERIGSLLGVPEGYWDIDDQGNIGWDEDALDDDTLFDEHGFFISDLEDNGIEVTIDAD
jgi:hypothetical protein